MATKDFQAGQIRANKLIASRSDGSKPSLLIYSSSAASNFRGGEATGLLTGVGSDVFIFVSGSKTDPTGFSSVPSGPRTAVTLFGGDIVVSGTLFAEHSVIEVDGNVTGSMSISGSLLVSQSAEIQEGLSVNTSRETGTEDLFQVYGSETAQKSTTLIKGIPSTSQVFILSGGNKSSADEADYTDTNFFVSGTIGSRDSSTRGTSVFGGDVVVSGSLSAASGLSSTRVSIEDNGTNSNYWVKVARCVNETSSQFAAATFLVIYEGKQGAAGNDVAIVNVRAGEAPGLGYHNCVVDLFTGTESSMIDKDDFVITLNNGSPYDAELWVRSPNTYQEVFVSKMGGSIPTTRPVGGTNEWSILSGQSWAASVTSLGLNIVAEYTDRIFEDVTAYKMYIGSGSIPGSLDSSSKVLEVRGNGTTDQVFLLSPEYPAAGSYNDISFFFSGSQGSHQDNIALSARGGGAALFGGDIVTSGSSYVLGGNLQVDYDTDVSASGSISVGRYDPDSSIVNDTQLGSVLFHARAGVKGQKGWGAGVVATAMPAAGTWTYGSDTAARLELRTTEDGEAWPVTRMSISPGGDVAIGSSSYSATSPNVNPTALLQIQDTRDPYADRSDIDDYQLLIGTMTPVTIHDSAGGSAGIGFKGAGTSNDMGGSIIYSRHQGSNRYNQGDLIFYNKESSASTTTPVEKIRLSASGSVLFMSGGGAASANAAYALDTNFWVSGSIGSTGTSTRGTAVFGGDLVVSGSTEVVGGFSAGADGVFPLTASLVDIGWDPSTSSDSVPTELRVTSYDSTIFTQEEIGKLSFYARENSSMTSAAEGASIVAKAAAGWSGVDNSASLEFNTKYATTAYKTARMWSTAERGYLQVFNPTDNTDYLSLSVGENADTLITTLEDNGSGVSGGHLTLSAQGRTYISSSKSQVLILSGTGQGALTSLDPVDFNDTNFFVSGAIGRRTEDLRGTALFGGDLATSGTLYAIKSFDEDNDAQFIIENANAGSNAHAVIRLRNSESRKTTSDFKIEKLATKTGMNGDIHLGGAAHFQNRSGSMIFHIGTGSLGAGDPWSFSLIDGASRSYLHTTGTGGGQVFILSGGNSTDIHDEKKYNDISFFVSGTIGSRGNTSAGAALFGGDLVVSGGMDVSGGTLVVDEVNDRVGINIASPTVVLAVSGSTAGDTIVKVLGSAGVKGLVAGYQASAYADGAAANSMLSSDFVVSGASDSGFSTLVNEPDGRASFGYKLLTKNGTEAPDYHHLYYDNGGGNVYRPFTTYISSSTGPQILLMSGANASVLENGPREWTDTNFFVSGTMGSMDSAVKGTSVFGGDVFVSGGMTVGFPGAAGDGSVENFVVNSKDAAGIITVNGNNNYVQFQTLDSSGQLTPGSDTFFHVSGTIGGTEDTGVAVFGGDTVISGTAHVLNDLNVTMGNGSGGSANGSAKNIVIDTDDVGGISILTPDTATSFLVFGNAANPVGSYFSWSRPSRQFSLLGNATAPMTFEIAAGNATGHDLIITGAIPADKQILFMSGGAASSVDETAGSDVAFYVSGTSGARDGSVRGVSVFGGDVVISGSLTGGSPLSIGNTAEISGSLYLAETAEPSIAATGESVLYTNAGNLYWKNAGGSAQQVGSGGGGAGTGVGWSAPSTQYIAATGSVLLGATSLAAADIILSGTGDAVFNEQGNAADFRVESNNKPHALFVSGNTNQVLILSGGAAASFDEAAALDVGFYVSGTLGSKDTSTRGTSVFGGDTHVSGVTYVEGSYLESIGHAGWTAYSDVVCSSTPTNRLSFSTVGISLLAGTGGSLFADGAKAFLNINTVGANDLTINLMSDDIDFNVNSDTGRIIEANAGTHQLTLGSGVTPASDAFMFVSGAIGCKDSSTVSGSTVFGGDVVVSGAAYFEQGISGSLTRLTDGSAYLIGGSSVTITSASNGAITISAVGGGGGSDSTGWIAPSLDVISTTGSVFFGVTGGSSNPDITFGSNGAATFNLQQGAVDFTVASDTKSHAILVSGSTDQVLILSGGEAVSTDEAAGSDVAFYVSGTVGSAGTTTRGTSVFGGDAVISGSIHTSQYIYHLGDTDTNIEFENNVVKIMAGDVGVLGTDPSADVVLIGSHGTASTKFGRVLILSGGAAASANESNATDINFFVSGTVGSKGTSTRGTSVFGGDLCVSGSSYVGGTLGIGTPSPAGILDVKGNGLTSQIFLLSGSGASVSVDESDYSDLSFFVSGAIGSRGTSIKGTSVFGGDVVVSGSLTVSAPGAGADVTFYGEDSSAIGLQWDADSGDHGKLTLGQDNHGVDFQVYGEDSNNYLQWGQANNVFSIYTPQGEIRTKGNVIFDYSSQGWDFTVNTNNKKAIFVDGSEDQILILSGGASTSLPGFGTDTGFFVSGTIGSMGDEDSKGTAVFGGDVLVSGSVSLARTANLTGGDGLCLGVGPSAISTAYATSDASTWFSGSVGGKDSATDRGVTVFAGDVAVSGSIIPGLDTVVSLGSPTNRFANVYTGDLHLRNDRGDWTILEEEDYLCVVNNKSGKKYKMVLESIDE